ncbi:MAG: MazG nucleotide pyrophosphohydrolase domain-containing protein [Patescibacteria group bacterium]|jgi:NTP pyrophosphatase (non-canonical NTP hydrolase)
MSEEKDLTLKQAQAAVKAFAERNGWEDKPNIDKLDHLHEELVEISQHIRYKSEQEREDFVRQNKDLFTEEIADLLFGVCRVANQFGVDLEEGFAMVQEKILKKYGKGKENNIAWKKKTQ